MSLASAIRTGVKAAYKITNKGRILSEVTVRRYTGADEFGSERPTTDETFKAYVELKQAQRDSGTGTLVTTKAEVLFLEQIPDLGGVDDRVEPIDPRDIIILPDGTTGPIVATEGPVDGETEIPYYMAVWLGVGGTARV